MTNISNQLNINNLLQTNWKDKFSPEQLGQIEIGLEEDVDVTIYADPKYNRDQMEQIRLGLKNNIDVTIYAKPDFSDEQMNQIRVGLELGLDVTVYANPNYHWLKMYKMWRELHLKNIENNPSFLKI